MTDHQSVEFAACAAQHRASLESRGYRALRQLGLEGHIIRNQPWKTYWRATNPRSRICFVKINYGYDRTSTNLAVGQKEAQLPAWFAAHFDRDSPITFPEVLDHWEQDGHAYVVFADQPFQQLSLFSIAVRPELVVLANQFLDRWTQIEMPPWWQDSMEIHDFAGQPATHLDPSDRRAFGFDLDDNIGIDERGRLFFFDFEFIQWSSPGLQRAYWCCKLATSRRHLLNLMTGRGLAASLAGGPGPVTRALPGRQAASAYLASISRTRTPSWYERSAVRLARTILESRS